MKVLSKVEGDATGYHEDRQVQKPDEGQEINVRSRSWECAAWDDDWVRQDHQWQSRIIREVPK